MPTPPPPAAALIKSGQPIFFAAARNAPGDETDAPDPGGSGTPARAMMPRARRLSPIARIAAGGGPMKTSPARAQRSAKSAFSERNP